MTVAVSCPYCNAAQTLTAAPTAGRAVCTRCGETFPVSGTGPLPTAATATAAAPAEPSRGGGRIVWIGLAAVAVAAAVLAAFLWPRGGVGPGSGPTEVRQVRPADLAALGWLPPETGLVAAVHVAQLREDAAGRDLLSRLGLGDGPDDAAGQERLYGVKAAEVDHFALGIEPQGFPPRFTLVVVTRSPVNAGAIRERLKATDPVPGGRDGRPLSRFRAEGLPEGSLWVAGERVLVFGWLHRNLEGVPTRPASGVDGLSAGLAEAVRDRLLADAVAWSALDLPEGMPPLAGTLLRNWLPEGDRDALQGLRQLAVGVRPGVSPSVELAVRGADDGVTGRLASVVRSWATERDLKPEDPVNPPAGWALLWAPLPAERLVEVVGRGKP